VFYSKLMAVAFGMDANKDAALDHNMIEPLKLVELAKKAPASSNIVALAKSHHLASRKACREQAPLVRKIAEIATGLPLRAPA
jgi:hypothetical protein